VSQSWFYQWKDGKLPPRAARRGRLKAEVARLFAVRQGTDGAPRITAALREAGWTVSENTVATWVRRGTSAVAQHVRERMDQRPRGGAVPEHRK
jgi:hypothetical protein